MSGHAQHLMEDMRAYRTFIINVEGQDRFSRACPDVETARKLLDGEQDPFNPGCIVFGEPFFADFPPPVQRLHELDDRRDEFRQEYDVQRVLHRTQALYIPLMKDSLSMMRLLVPVVGVNAIDMLLQHTGSACNNLEGLMRTRFRDYSCGRGFAGFSVSE